jgi:hypothetical protein
MSKIGEYIKNNLGALFILLMMILAFTGIAIKSERAPVNQLKDYKDGIQNHLVWGINGSCYFVRPNDDVTVYLVKVPDCEKGK